MNFLTFNSIVFNITGVANRFSSNQQYLKNVSEILSKLHDKLKSSFQRGIYSQDLPVLLFDKCESTSELKSNIDKYIQFGLATTQEKTQRAKLFAMQLISDYCVGLKISELQRSKMYNGFSFDIVAGEVELLLSNYNCSGTDLGDLLSDVKSMKGTGNLDGAL